MAGRITTWTLNMRVLRAKIYANSDALKEGLGCQLLAVRSRTSAALKPPPNLSPPPSTAYPAKCKRKRTVE